MNTEKRTIRSALIILIAVFLWTLHSIQRLAGEDYGTCPDHHVPLVFYYWSSEPSCTAWGNAVVTCTVCDYRDVVDVPPLGHDYQPKIVTEATCTDEGLIRHACSRCGDAYDEKTEALGHSYTEKTTAASCTKNGKIDHICQRCGDSYSETIKALGHKYTAKITKEATCKEDGVKTYTCSRCGDTYMEAIPASGHDVTYEIKEASCTEVGYKKGICKNCQEKILVFLPKLKHEPEDFVIVKEASCTEDGLKEAVCKNCGEKISEKISKSGHDYPDVWTIDSKPGFFTKGLESKTCSICGEKLSREIPADDKSDYIIFAACMAIIAIGVWRYIKKTTKAVEKTRKLSKPSFEDKTIVYAGKNERLIGFLKGKHFLQVNVCDDEGMTDCVKENEPDLTIIEIANKRHLNKLLKQRESELCEQTLGLIGSEKFISKYRKELDELVTDESIIAYLSEDTDEKTLMLKMIMPILKPQLNSDESLANIGAVAEFIGIPYISKIIDAYVSGRDVKAVIEEGDIGISETATIISDIASILGLDTVAEVAGLVDDIESIKAGLAEDAGAYEGKGAISGAKDIIEVISDIVDKD